MTRGSLRWCGVVVMGFAGAATAWGQVVHTVNQVDMEFIPANITIAQGDSVKWVWSSGIHTVTHGNPCTRDSNFLFDAPLNMNARTFQFQFNTPGIYNYFCTPHCFMGMVGRVFVQSAGGCAGTEAVTKTRCVQKNGVNTLVVKVAGKVGDFFLAELSSGAFQVGTINDRGKGKAKFKGVPSGTGTVNVTFGCGVQAGAEYTCP